MPHPDIRNHVGLAHAWLPMQDEAGQPLIVALLEGTWIICPDGKLSLADPQPPIELAGVPWDGDPLAGWQREPQSAFVKPGTDVVLLGHAVAPAAGTRRMDVSIRIAANTCRAVAFGPRRMLQGKRITEPDVFERIPLRWQYAFGGWDRRAAEASRHRCESRNPLGHGFRDPALPVDAEVEMPQIEDPATLFERYGEAPAPRGFGFVPSHWWPRAGHAGTYDDAWARQRMPLLPQDFDRRHFNAAAPALINTPPLSGGEAALVVGATAQGRLTFELPQLGVPLFEVEFTGHRRQTLKMVLDTVIVDTDAMRLTMLWRAHALLPRATTTLLAAAFHANDPRARCARNRA